LQLSGQKFHGRLFVLDKTAMIADDLTLGILLAHQITALMDQYVSIADLKKAAAARERLSMARDLHDGLLQTLTGIALQVETAKRLLGSNNPEVSQRLGELQTLIIEEQRDLRHYIAKLKPLPQPVENDKLTLHGRLTRLAESIEQQWGLKTSLTLPYPAALERLPDDIYSLVRESLINSARHALATEVQASLSIEDDRLHLRVSDDGQGFPFQGYYDLSQLAALGLGPKSLMERIQALHGQLRVGSDRSGSVLKMSIPLTEHGRPDAQPINPDPTLSDEPNR
jgi:signal transduction histidine kinase